LLTPSKIFHRLILDEILGDFESPRKFEISGICHITGGGIPGNVPRILPAELGAKFKNLHDPHEAVRDLQKMGGVDDAEAYRTWHGGTAMLIFCRGGVAERVCESLNLADKSVEARVVGEVAEGGEIEILSRFSGEKLVF